MAFKLYILTVLIPLQTAPTSNFDYVPYDTPCFSLEKAMTGEKLVDAKTQLRLKTFARCVPDGDPVPDLAAIPLPLPAPPPPPYPYPYPPVPVPEPTPPPRPNVAYTYDPRSIPGVGYRVARGPLVRQYSPYDADDPLFGYNPLEGIVPQR